MAALHCEICGATVSSGKARKGVTLRHADDCATRPGASRDALLRAAGRDGSISAVASDTEIVDAVRRGALSVDAAMNRDF